MGKLYDISTVVDSRPMSASQWGIVATCGLAMLVDGFDAQAIGYVAPAMIKDLGLDRALLGPIFTAGVLGMGLGNILLGLLSDKIGRKPVLIASLVLFGIVTFLKSLAGSFETLLILQVTAGLGIGGAYPNAIALTSEYVPARRRSVLVTLSALGFLAGTTCGGFLAAAMLPTLV
jgi:MFS transporter, AAHS family, 4-hydroxybenzoate transporter